MLCAPNSCLAWISIAAQFAGGLMIVGGAWTAYRKLARNARRAQELSNASHDDGLTVKEHDNFKGWFNAELAARDVQQVRGQLLTGVGGAVLTTAGSILSGFIV